MRLISSFFYALTAITALSGCGTKTPLTLPPPVPRAATPPVAAPAASREASSATTTDDSNKATEPRQ
ncbi:MAG: lipoprotein [Burkholderiaceae bacterium]|nr:lipoprotein [Sulfuritalea sp.]MCF8173750.1 lipoprotein [Burkholderiaceae bacterium]MCF8184910.1 lipoprotein [Polynucleobacter sp.]